MTEGVVRKWFFESFFGTSLLRTGCETFFKASVVVETIELVGNFVVVSFSEFGLEKMSNIVADVFIISGLVGNSFLGT